MGVRCFKVRPRMYIDYGNGMKFWMPRNHFRWRPPIKWRASHVDGVMAEGKMNVGFYRLARIFDNSYLHHKCMSDRVQLLKGRFGWWGTDFSEEG